MHELVTAGEDVLVFYNDKASFNYFVEMMRSERNRMDDSSPLRYTCSVQCPISFLSMVTDMLENRNIYATLSYVTDDP